MVIAIAVDEQRLGSSHGDGGTPPGEGSEHRLSASTVLLHAEQAALCLASLLRMAALHAADDLAEQSTTTFSAPEAAFRSWKLPKTS